MKQLKVRKDNVISALKWLQRHHTGYTDITIIEVKFDWMGDKNEFDIVLDTEVTNIILQKYDNLE